MKRVKIEFVFSMSVFLALLSIVSFLLLFPGTEPAIAAGLEGDGTEANPFLVKKPEDFNYIREHTVAGAVYYYKLLNDIDLTGYLSEGGAGYNEGNGWEPIGTNSDQPFKGVFDGNGKVIKGLTINRPGSKDNYIGLFGYIDGATIKNIKLENLKINGYDYVGGLVGYSKNSKIENCYITGSVSGKSYVGGLVGSNFSGNISSSFSSANVTAKEYMAGGLIGKNNNSTIRDSFATGSVTGNNDVGGLVGYNESGSIMNSFAAGTVTGNQVIGGLVGYITVGSNINNSYAAGNVICNNCVGGLVGYNEAIRNISNSYWDINISGQVTSAGGEGKTTTEMKQQVTFSGWDFEDTWAIMEGLTYPYLKNGARLDFDGKQTFYVSNQPGYDSVQGKVYNSNNECFLVKYTALYNNQPVIENEIAQTNISNGEEFSLSVNEVVYKENEQYKLWVWAEDSFGYKSAPNLLTVIKDVTKPEVSLSLEGSTTAKKSHSTTVMVTDANELVSCEYQWTTGSDFPKGGTWTSLTSGDTITLDGETGTYYLHFRAIDEAGNIVETTSNGFHLDNAPPQVNLSVEGDSTEKQTHSITVTLTDISKIVSSEYQWSQSSDFPAGGTWLPFVSGDKITIDGVTGIYYLYIRATDELGNTAEITSNRFNLDNTAPDSPVLSVEDQTVSTETVQISGTAEKGAKITIYGGTETLTGQADAHTGQFSIEISLKPNQSNILMVTAIDIAGNTSEPAMVTITHKDKSTGESNKDRIVDVVNEENDDIGNEESDDNSNNRRSKSSGSNRSHHYNQEVKPDYNKLAVVTTEKEKATLGFTDISGHWAEKDINTLASLGYIGGYPDGTFQPEKEITRAEYISILVRALNLEKKTGKIFKDTKDHWAREAIATAYAHGIINGYNNQYFGADDPLTREQMAAILVNALKLEPVKTYKTFADQENISSWALEFIKTVVGHKILAGYQDNTIRPQQKATRAEIVSVIVRALSQKNLLH